MGRISETPQTPRRPRKVRITRPGVRRAERVARVFITLGGVGTILSVSLIFVFLLSVVVPLFRPASLEERAVATVEEGGTGRAAAVGVDEYGRLLWEILEDGTLRVIRLESGRVLSSTRPLGGMAPAVVQIDHEKGAAAFGFADGSIRFGEIRLSTTYPARESLPEALQGLAPGAVEEHAGGLLEVLEDGNLRHRAIGLALEEPIPPSHDAPVVRIDRTDASGSKTIASLCADGYLSIRKLRERTNMMTGEVVRSFDESRIPTEGLAGDSRPDWLFLSGSGTSLLLLWKDGSLVRFDLRDIDRPVVAEKRRVTSGATVTAAMWLLGRTTLLVGDSRGRLHGWFGVQREGSETSDGLVFVGAKEMPGGGRAVTALSPSPRNRLVAVAYEGGEIRLFNVTNERLLHSARSGAGDRIDHLSIAPKEDGILARAGPRIGWWSLDPRHPEASISGLFGRIWYEGYPEPDHVWQSAGATDDFERKLGLVPLVFGTLKATLYSMMLGVPIALLAAIFTSEFLPRRMRVLVKSVIEMMAGLPSVVLGFLAALVIAPIAQDVVPATLSLLFTMPFSILLGAYLWQFLPQGLSLRLSGWQKLLAIGLTLPVAVGMALLLGPLVERIFFEGKMFEWLDGRGRLGDGSGGWMLLFLPLSVLLVVILQTRFANPAIRKVSSGWSRSRSAAADFAKFLLSTGLSLLMAWTASKLLAAGGLDPRGSFVGTFNQRNSLVVGFVMGFAIIPIIYTLAEDALSSVPDHLRQGSLGAGATPWQTAFRIVVPTAMSGLFSAVMVGLGRAVGETMIVVMATGNTPVREWNIFSGFRTLSANIAVEMPEAPKNTTHYRTLFLAALVLFAFTFVLNTLAELVRQRFRKKAFQL